MLDSTLPLPILSPVEGKEIVARFYGGQLSSDGGLLVLREIEQRLNSPLKKWRRGHAGSGVMARMRTLQLSSPLRAAMARKKIARVSSV